LSRALVRLANTLLKDEEPALPLLELTLD